MARYQNGFVPNSVLVKLASGTDRNGYWEFLASPGLAARWAAAKKEAERRFGRTIYIRTGWNMYRPYWVQKEARQRACNSGNCNGAASPGYSSHGGSYAGRDALAIDVDPNGLTWAQVWEACRAVGFVCGAITEAISGIRGGEPWHIIDYDPWRAVPASEGSTPFPNQEEDDMSERAEQQIAELWQALLPGKSGVKTQGDVNKAIMETRSAAVKAESNSADAKVASESLVADFKQGQAGVNLPGRLYTLLTKAAAGTEVSVDIAKLATELTSQLGDVGGASPAEVKEIVQAALSALVLTTKE